MSVNIEPLTQLDAAALARVITGYTSGVRWVVRWEDAADSTRFVLTPEPLPEPITRSYDYLDEEKVRRYRDGLAHGCSAGAFAAGSLVGVALAEPHFWNGSLWVWELHVADAFRGQGIGRRLVDWLAARAGDLGLRTIVCETQNNNAPAIAFYRRVGFQLEGVDVSYYTNEDWPDGDVAVFMKKRLPASD